MVINCIVRTEKVANTRCINVNINVLTSGLITRSPLSMELLHSLIGKPNILIIDELTTKLLFLGDPSDGGDMK